MKLTDAEFELLKEIIQHRNPVCMDMFEFLGKRPLDTDQREELRDILSDELIAKGLREDDEPNEYGLKVEDLISKLAHY